MFRLQTGSLPTLPVTQFVQIIAHIYGRVTLDLQTNAGRRGHQFAIEGTQEHGKQGREGHRPNSCQESNY